jgi:hypothetical protein
MKEELPNGHASWITMAKFTKGQSDNYDFKIQVRNEQVLDIVSIKAGAIRSQAFIELIESNEILTDSQLRILEVLVNDFGDRELIDKMKSIRINRFNKQIKY